MTNPFQCGGIVEGAAFCNRKKDLADLTAGIESSEKLFIYPERRAAAASYNAASAFCPGFRLLVAFDGGSGAVDQNGTWAWPGSNWVQGHPTHSPSRRELLGMANDETIGHVVIFGGQTRSKFFGDTWELRPAAMHQ
jgi:hypothetical protein